MQNLSINLKFAHMTDIEINREPIELCKLLKFANLVGSGGEAKFAVTNELVKVNGKTETRKAKQLVSGDIVGFKDQEFTVKLV